MMSLSMSMVVKEITDKIFTNLKSKVFNYLTLNH